MDFLGSFGWLFWLVWVVGVLLILAYAAVLPFGAPFLPTLGKQSAAALDLMALKKGQRFVDLGCGDGRLLAEAAKRGLLATGYELNPFLAAAAWLRTRRYGRRVSVRWGNFWRADISEADGVFVFLIGHHMARLDKMLAGQNRHQPLKLVSHAFKVPKRQPVKKSGALFLYIYNNQSVN